MASTRSTHEDGGQRIAAVSVTLGVPAPTIRSWERRYGFPVPPRTDGKHRRYTSTEIDQLRSLRDLITKGYPAAEAVAMLQGGNAAAAPLGPDLRDAVVDAAIRLDADAVRATLDRAAERLGVESTVRDVLMSAMRGIGSAWQNGTCSIEHEHVATEAVRAWLSKQASMAPPPFRSGPIVLACGPTDLHTVGIEAFSLVLARRGWAVRVLGAMTPPETLRAAARSLGAVATVVVSQRSVTRQTAVASIAAAASIPGVRSFYAGDGFAAPSARKKVPGIYLGTDIVAAAGVLESALAPRVASRAAP
jgi:methanogenic corrinoid protein MtbC1